MSQCEADRRDAIDTAISDLKRLLKVMNFVVNEALEDDSDEQNMIFALIDSIETKIAEVEKLIDAQPAG